MTEEMKYIFTASWYDSAPQLVREFYFTYFVQDGTVELFDRRNHKTFLRRMACDTLDEQDLYVGNTIYVLSRKLYLDGYADVSTKQMLDSKSERTIVLLKSPSVWSAGKLLDFAYRQHLVLTKLRILQLGDVTIDALQTNIKTEWFPIDKLFQQSVILVELLGENVVNKIDGFIMNEIEQSNREDELGFLFQSEAFPDIQSENFLVPDDRKRPVQMQHCTCCIIKPHALKEGSAGQILMDIANAGFVISAIDMFNFNFEQSRQFHQVYKGVLPEYPGLVSQLCLGSSIAMCIENPELGSATLQQFRLFAGPADPDIGRHIRPETLRAKYGSDKIKNAIHCTDLVEDGCLEVQYLFNATGI